MTHWISTLEVAQVNKGLHYQGAQVPFAARLADKFVDGGKIFVHGLPKKDAGEFSVNVQSGTDEDANVHFHLNARYGANVIVLNSRRDGVWQDEIRRDMECFEINKPFLIELTANPDGYDVLINGEFFGVLPYRMAAEEATHLVIDGDLRLPGVHFPMAIVKNRSNISIPGNVQMTCVYNISGMPSKGEIPGFSINFQTGESPDSDIIFHFNPRYSDQCVVRNTRIGGEWGDEEKEGAFPIDSKEFGIMIVARKKTFHSWVNGAKFASYAHRADMTTASVLNIEGDVDIDDVSIDCAPTSIPAGSDFEEVLFETTWRDDVYNPESPVDYNLTEFHPKSVICISAVVKPGVQRFHVNLQNEPGENDDVVLHYNPRFDDRQVILNSREGGNWLEETRWDEFPFRDNARFELIIQCNEDGFSISLNNEPAVKYHHRLAYDGIKWLLIRGDVFVKRIIYA